MSMLPVATNRSLIPFRNELDLRHRNTPPVSQVISQEALTRLLVEKGIFSKEEFLEMVKTVNLEMKKKRGSNITNKGD